MALFNLMRAAKKDQKNFLNTINIPRIPPIIIDCHMHIMSSHCTPLPLLWNQVGGLQLSTKTLDIGGVALRPVMGKIGIVGKKETVQICDLVEAQNRETYEDLNEYPQQTDKLFSIMLGMPMDMEYAHHAGLEGHKIYYQVNAWSYIQVLTTTAGASSAPDTHSDRIMLAPKPEDIIGENPLSEQLKKEFADLRKEQEKELQRDYSHLFASRSSYQQTVNSSRYFVVLNYKDKADNKIKRKIAWLSEEENKDFVPWLKQIRQITISTLKHPWRQVPFFHYEPRRWKGIKQDFRKQIATKRQAGIFLGIKMYPALGYKPDDWQRLRDLTDFYQFCCDEDIPIITHGSAAGMFTHDRALYFQLDRPAPRSYADIESSYTLEQKNESRFDQSWEEFYFSENYVSPTSWLNVLGYFNNLRICIAHFGGDEKGFTRWGGDNKKLTEHSSIKPWDERIIELMRSYDNCYVDISCFYVKDNFEQFKKIMAEDKDDKIKNKVLFGTDWYMIEKDKLGYKKFCLQTKKALDMIDKSLWPRFTCLNPLKFLNLKEVAGNLAEGLRKEIDGFDQEELAKKGIKIPKANKQINDFEKLLTEIDVESYKKFLNYE